MNQPQKPRITTNTDLAIERLIALEKQKASHARSILTRDDGRIAEDQEWIDSLWQYTVPASSTDYDVWLTGHLASGGQVTHFYDYPMDPSRWYVANIPFALRPLYGSMQVNILVPKGVTLTGDTGHSTLYMFDGFRTRGFHGQPGIVPVYTDTAIVE